MKLFSQYADYYDSIYTKKAYAKEVAYVKKLFNKFSLISVKSILSMGCGTCKHEVLFAKQEYNISGVDRSETMIAYAKKRVENVRPKIKLYCKDINTIRLNKKFDAVLSLFNVIGYQTTQKNIEAFIANCARHIKSKGVVVFDAWHKPAIIKSRPEAKTVTVKGKNGNIIERRTTPKLDLKKSILEITFEIIVYNKTKKVKKFIERHVMRFFTLPELVKLAEKYGMELVHTSQPFEFTKPASDNSWNMWVVLKKK